MSNEQNIDDILKLLKSSVSEDSGLSQPLASEDVTGDINDEALKNRLKMQYLENEDSDSGLDFFDNSDEDGYNNYSIDNDFLTEAVTENSEIEISEEPEELEEPEAPEESEEPEEEFVFFEPTISVPASDEDDMPWFEDDEIIAQENEQEPEATEVLKEEKIEFDESALFEFPDELLVNSPVANEPADELANDSYEDDESYDEEDEEDETTFEDLELRADDESLGNIEDYETFEEPATFSLYDDTVIADSDIGSSDLEGDGTEEQKNEFNDIVIDSTETGKALDFDVYAPSYPAKDESVDIYTLFKEEKAKQNMSATEIPESVEDIAVSETSEDPEPVDEIKIEEVSETATNDGIVEDENDELDFSEMNIMLQLGFEDELKDTVGEEKVEDFVRYDIADKEKQRVESEKRKIEARADKVDYVSPEQNDAIKERYKAESYKSLIKLLGVTAIAFFIGIIELMPILRARLEGVLDYNAYPAIYMLFGSQLLILAAVIVYKPIISGLIYAFSTKPTRHSAVALSVAMTVLYDIIMILVVAIAQEDYPPMFNGLAALLLVVSSAVDYLMIICERKTFNVYSVGEKKYTLADESERGRIKEKLLRGGVDSTKNVYTPEAIDFPQGFRQLCKTENEWRLTKIFTIPVFIFSILALIVNMSLGRELGEVAGTLMMAFCMSMPLMIIVSETLPCFIATCRLEKRGSAVVGSEMYKKYAECDMIAFDDTYLFEKCKSEELGVAIYDTSVGYLALGCFKALYDKLGGPLSELNIDLPDVFKFDDVKIRRISKNGVDAIIDGRHSLLAGDYAFMQRYGLSFPRSESDNVRGAGVLCLSLNQKVTAKISVKYNTVEIFEMLAERLADDGITPIITTADPLINSSIIAKNRKIGDAPIGVVHRNSSDLEAVNTRKNKYDPDGIVSCISSLKLAETLVWCKRVEKIRHICERVVTIFSAAGILFSVFAMVLGISQYLNQAMISLYLVCELVLIGAITFINIPDKEYFSVKALREDIEAELEAQMSENEREALRAQRVAQKQAESGNAEHNKRFKLNFSFLNFKNNKNRKKDQDEQ